MEERFGATLDRVQMTSRRNTGYNVLPAKARKLMMSIGHGASRNEIMESGVSVNPKLSTMVCAE